MRTNTFFTALVLAVLLWGAGTDTARAQSEGGRVAFGINGGLVKYWGEFTDKQFWYGGDAFVRYNIIPWVSIHGTVGLAQARYKLNQEIIDRYPDYFGPNGAIGGTYPFAPQVRIEEKNAVRMLTYELTGVFNIFPREKFVPYIFGGIGLLDWNPTNLFQNEPLQNNANNRYDKTIISIPVGIGFEQYITDDIVFSGKGTFRFINTDFLDDYEREGTSSDGFMTFGVGFSYYIFGESDFDKDGLTNSEEEGIGTDPRNPDTDGDGLTDYEEVRTYNTDPLKIDSDGDGLDDRPEIFTHNTSPVKADTDADGVDDGKELARKIDPNNPDTDGDDLLDGEEIDRYNTDPLKLDSDEDGLKDGDEVRKHNTNPLAGDSDKDGLGDGAEVNTHKTNPAAADTDNDGLPDGAEINQYKTDPLKLDSDGDGLNDGDEVNTHRSDPMKADTDGDGLNDGDEIRTHNTSPTTVDTDNDGLSDGEEVMKTKSNPAVADTDGDGLRDGDEVKRYKTDPNNTDSDDDRLADGREVNETRTDPADADTDDDSVIDGLDDCPLTAGEASTDPGRNGCPPAPKIGTKTDFPDILFIVNTDNFNFDEPKTAPSLAKLLEYVNQCENLAVMIEGHASSEGQVKRNQELSEMRAKKVREWLIEQGVNPRKIMGAIGYGSSRPKIEEPKPGTVSAEELENIRKQNRRITVEVVKTCDS